MGQVANVGWQLKIKAWAAKPNPPGGRVYEFADKEKPSELQDGDIIVKIADHEHIGIVAADGTIYQAEETKAGVTDRGRFSLAGNAPLGLIDRAGSGRKRRRRQSQSTTSRLNRRLDWGATCNGMST